MYMFPFNQVLPHESIIIYGAGYLGKSYWSQIKALDYCHVVCFVDANFKLQLDLGVPIISPEKIIRVNFDKIVIAVVDKNTQAEIYDRLRSLQIEPERIVCGSAFLNDFSAIRKIPEVDSNHAWKHHKLSMAFVLCSGLGDCIIGLRWIYAALANSVTDDVGVDIYSTSHAIKKYLPELTDESVPINGLFSVDEENIDYTKYDVAIYLSYTIRFIFSPDFNRIERKSSTFSSIVLRMWQRAEQYGLSDKGSDLYVHFARCRLQNMNCYTAMKIYGLSMEDWHIPIHVEADVGLNLPEQYIAINYGWGDFAAGDTNVRHVKIWPLEFYEMLILLLRERFPALPIVQLGVKGTPKMKGVDLYVFDKPLHTTKYVLKHALLLIDGEGGLPHLASQLGTKCAVLFGPTPVHYFGYDCNINIVSDGTNCHGCYYMYEDFRICAKGMNEAECMYSLRPEKVLREIEGYLESSLDA